MSAQLGVTVQGERELNAKLKNPKKLRKPMEKYLERASTQLKNYARIFSPVKYKPPRNFPVTASLQIFFGLKQGI